MREVAKAAGSHLFTLDVCGRYAPGVKPLGRTTIQMALEPEQAAAIEELLQRLLVGDLSRKALAAKKGAAP